MFLWLLIVTYRILGAFPMFITLSCILRCTQGRDGSRVRTTRAGGAAEGATQEEGAEEEDLPECPDHHPSTYVEGKPRSIISLPLFLLSCSAIN